MSVSYGLCVLGLLVLSVPSTLELASSNARCDHSLKILETRQGKIHNSALQTWSPRPIDCSWLITSPVGNRVVFSFSQFYMKCGREWLSVASLTERPVKLCGIHLPAPFELTGGNITVTHHFYPHFYPVSEFKLSYIKDSGPCYPGEFECYSERCLPASWHCNGQVECLGEGDNLGSDEDGCDESGSEHHTDFVNQIPFIDTTTNTIPVPLFNTDAPPPKGPDFSLLPHGGPCGGYLDAFYGSFTPPVLTGKTLECVWTVDPHDSRPLKLELQQLYLDRNDTIIITDRPYGTGNIIKTINNMSNNKAVEVESHTGLLSLIYRTPSASKGWGFNATYRIKDYCFPWEGLCGGSMGGCYTQKQRCDGHWDCPETGLDEEACGGCPAGHFLCGAGNLQKAGHQMIRSVCFSINERCNYQLNCADGSDERECTICQHGTFHCDSDRCVFESWRCDGQVDCKDGTDELNCTVTLPRKVINHIPFIDTTTNTIPVPLFNTDAPPPKGPDFSLLPHGGPCGGYLDAFYGSFTPPVLTGKTLECVWTVDPHDLRPLKLELQQLYLDRNDTIIITDRPYGTGNIIKTINNMSNNKAVEVESHTGLLSLIYRTPSASKGWGFNATYRIKDYCFPWEGLCGGSMGGCYTQKQRCDGHWDCPETGLDEEACGGCPAGHFLCGAGNLQKAGHQMIRSVCFSINERCNYQLNCADGSDERECTICQHGTFHCDSDRCVFESWRCDGQVDCKDGTDELNCTVTLPRKVINHIPFIDTTTNTIPVPLFNTDAPPPKGPDFSLLPHGGPCGGYLDAFYGSFTPPVLTGKTLECVWTVDPHDSRPLKLELQQLYLDRNDTIIITDRPYGTGNIIKTINNMSNNKAVEVESHTGLLSLIYRTPSASKGWGFNATYRIKDYCFPWEGLCGGSMGGCYTQQQRCDGHWDCPETGLDEEACGGCPAGHFLCGAGNLQKAGHQMIRSVCFSINERCNYQLNCADGSDERECTICQHGTFHCDSDRCVFESWRCDGQVDCKDGTDELNCTVTLPRKVITAATVGSLVCGLLLVIAMGCTCKLYSLRNREYSMFAPITRQEAELIQQQAPPSYGQLIAQGIIPPVEDFPTENPNEAASLSLRGILQLLRQDNSSSPRRRRRPRFVRRAVRRLRRWGLIPRPAPRSTHTTATASQQTEDTTGSEPSHSSPGVSSLATEVAIQPLPQKLCLSQQTETPQQQAEAPPPLPPPINTHETLPVSVPPSSPSLALFFQTLGRGISRFRPSSSPTFHPLSASPSFSSSSLEDEVLLIPLSDDTTSEDDVPLLT